MNTYIPVDHRRQQLPEKDHEVLIAVRVSLEAHSKNNQKVKLKKKLNEKSKLFERFVSTSKKLVFFLRSLL